MELNVEAADNDSYPNLWSKQLLSMHKKGISSKAVTVMADTSLSGINQGRNHTRIKPSNLLKMSNNFNKYNLDATSFITVIISFDIWIRAVTESFSEYNTCAGKRHRRDLVVSLLNGKQLFHTSLCREVNELINIRSRDKHSLPKRRHNWPADSICRADQLKEGSR